MANQREHVKLALKGLTTIKCQTKTKQDLTNDLLKKLIQQNLIEEVLDVFKTNELKAFVNQNIVSTIFKKLLADKNYNEIVKIFFEYFSLKKIGPNEIEIMSTALLNINTKVSNEIMIKLWSMIKEKNLTCNGWSEIRMLYLALLQVMHSNKISIENNLKIQN